MARIEIMIEGFDKNNGKTGSAMRVLNGARSKEFILDNVDHVKGCIKVGQCGRHVITLDDGVRKMQRIDEGRRGAKAGTIGTFKEIK